MIYNAILKYTKQTIKGENTMNGARPDCIFRVFGQDAHAWDYVSLRYFITGMHLPRWSRGSNSLKSHNHIKRKMIFPIELDLLWSFDIYSSFLWDCIFHVIHVQGKYNIKISKTIGSLALDIKNKNPIKYEKLKHIQDKFKHLDFFLTALLRINSNDQGSVLDDLSGSIANMFDYYHLSPKEHECYDSENVYENECMWQSLRMVSYLFGELRAPSPPPSTEGVPP